MCKFILAILIALTTIGCNFNESQDVIFDLPSQPLEEVKPVASCRDEYGLKGLLERYKDRLPEYDDIIMQKTTSCPSRSGQLGEFVKERSDQLKLANREQVLDISRRAAKAVKCLLDLGNMAIEQDKEIKAHVDKFKRFGIEPYFGLGQYPSFYKNQRSLLEMEVCSCFLGRPIDWGVFLEAARQIGMIVDPDTWKDFQELPFKYLASTSRILRDIFDPVLYEYGLTFYDVQRIRSAYFDYKDKNITYDELESIHQQTQSRILSFGSGNWNKIYLSQFMIVNISEEFKSCIIKGARRSTYSHLDPNTRGLEELIAGWEFLKKNLK